MTVSEKKTGRGGFLQDALGAIVGPFEPLLRLGIGAVIKWVLLQGPVALRSFAVIFLLVFLLAAGWFWRSFSGMQDILLKGTATQLDDPNQNYPGLEAIVLSGLQTHLPGSLGSVGVTDDFITASDNIQKAMAAVPFDGTAQVTSSQVCPSGSSLSPPSCGLVVHTVPEGHQSSSTTDKYLVTVPSDRAKKAAFLFIPAMVIPPGNIGDEVSEDSLRSAVDKTKYLRHDLEVSDAIASNICGLTTINILDNRDVVEPSPAQVYFITLRGVLRICEARINDQYANYIDQFDATSFFPSRNYFKNALKKENPQLTSQSSIEDRRASRVFALTQPYIDLGGNGFVITACRRLSTLPNGVFDSALCLDLPLSSKEVSVVRERLQQLGTATEANCSSSPSILCGSANDPWNPELTDKVNKLKAAGLLSDLYGKIQILRQTDTSLDFSVPVHQSVQDSGRSGTFFYCVLDLGKIQFMNTLKGTCVGASFLLFVTFVALLIGTYGARIQEQERAFQTVDGVMRDADTPYIRLDSGDRFRDFNEAFARLLGHSILLSARASLEGKTFKSLLADPKSEEKYEEIEDARREGADTGPYSVNLKKSGGGTVAVVVHGAAVPGPRSPQDSNRETFGIVVKKGSGAGIVTTIPPKGPGAMGMD
jgi:hypothetical protein